MRSWCIVYEDAAGSGQKVSLAQYHAQWVEAMLPKLDAFLGIAAS